MAFEPTYGYYNRPATIGGQSSTPVPTAGSPQSFGAYKQKKAKKKSWLNVIKDIPGAGLGEVKDFVTGLPHFLHFVYNDIDRATGDILPFNDAKEFMTDDIAKAILHELDYKYLNKDPRVTLRRMAESPLSSTLDALALFTFGGSLVAKGGMSSVAKSGEAAMAAKGVKGSAARSTRLQKSVEPMQIGVGASEDVANAMRSAYVKERGGVTHKTDAGDYEYFLPTQKTYKWSVGGKQHEFTRDYSTNPIKAALYQDLIGDKVMSSPGMQSLPIVGTKSRAKRDARRGGVAPARHVQAIAGALAFIDKTPDVIRDNIPHITGEFDPEEMSRALSVDSETPIRSSKHQRRTIEEIISDNGLDDLETVTADGIRAAQVELARRIDEVENERVSTLTAANTVDDNLKTQNLSKRERNKSLASRRNHRRQATQLMNERRGLEGVLATLREAATEAGEGNLSAARQSVSDLHTHLDRLYSGARMSKENIQRRGVENAALREAASRRVSTPAGQALYHLLRMHNAKRSGGPDMADVAADASRNLQEAMDAAKAQMSDADYKQFVKWVAKPSNVARLTHAVRKLQEADATNRVEMAGTGAKPRDVLAEFSSRGKTQAERSEGIRKRQRELGVSETGTGISLGTPESISNVDRITARDVLVSLDHDSIRAVLQHALADQVAKYRHDLLSRHAIVVPLPEAKRITGKGGSHVIIAGDGIESELSRNVARIIDALDSDVRAIFSNDKSIIIDDLIARYSRLLQFSDGEAVVVPKNIYKALFRNAEGDGNTILNMIERGPNRAWRAWMLGARPAWYGTQLASNTILLMLAASPIEMAKRAFATVKNDGLKGMRDELMHYFDKDLVDIVRAEAPDITSTGLHKVMLDLDEPIDGGLVKRMLGKAAFGPEAGMRIAGKYIDDPFRVWRFIQIMRPHAVKMQRELSKRGLPATRREAMEQLMSDDRILDIVSKKTMDDMINFRDLDPAARDAIRPFLPFYSWIAGSSRYTAQMAMERPWLFNALMSIGMASGEKNREELESIGKVPEWMQQYTVVDGNLINLQALNPLSGGADIAGMLSSLLPGGKDGDQGWNPLSSLQPGLRAPLEATFGVDAFTKRKLPELIDNPNMDKKELLLRRYIRQYPWARLAFEREDNETKDSGRSIMTPRTGSQLLAKEAYPFPMPRAWNQQAAVQTRRRDDMAKEQAMQRAELRRMLNE